MKSTMKKAVFFGIAMLLLSGCATTDREARRKVEMDNLQKEFAWWPTDAKPAPVKDRDRGGYWWWPEQPATVKHLWGNRGYCYVYKIIFDYKEEELPPPQAKEMRPSLIIKKIIKNVKIYFDYDKASLRSDARTILENAVGTLRRNPKADILITGNCDIRGSEAYNDKLGKRRGKAVKDFMLEQGIPEEHIRIISRGKLDAVAPVTDLVGMQKDRNAQFMIAEVQEVMIPYEGPVPAQAQKTEDGSYVEEEKQTIEAPVKVSTKEYTIKKGDTLWMIAERELGSGHRWKYLYQLNKDVIKDPNKLKAGKKIIIPIE